MEKKFTGKMGAEELDQVIGGAGFVYWTKAGDKFHVVAANRSLNRDEILEVWNSNGMSVPVQKDKQGNVIPGSTKVSVHKSIDSSSVENLRKALEARYGNCQYIEFK